MFHIYFLCTQLWERGHQSHIAALIQHAYMSIHTFEKRQKPIIEWFLESEGQYPELCSMREKYFKMSPKKPWPESESCRSERHLDIHFLLTDISLSCILSAGFNSKSHRYKNNEDNSTGLHWMATLTITYSSRLGNLLASLKCQ